MRSNVVEHVFQPEVKSKRIREQRTKKYTCAKTDLKGDFKAKLWCIETLWMCKEEVAHVITKFVFFILFTVQVKPLRGLDSDHLSFIYKISKE